MIKIGDFLCSDGQFLQARSHIVCVAVWSFVAYSNCFKSNPSKERTVITFCYAIIKVHL